MPSNLPDWALEEARRLAEYWNPRATIDDVDVERIAEALVDVYRRGVRHGEHLMHQLNDSYNHVEIARILEELKRERGDT